MIVNIKWAKGQTQYLACNASALREPTVSGGCRCYYRSSKGVPQMLWNIDSWGMGEFFVQLWQFLCKFEIILRFFFLKTKNDPSFLKKYSKILISFSSFFHRDLLAFVFPIQSKSFHAASFFPLDISNQYELLHHDVANLLRNIFLSWLLRLIKPY